MADNRHAEAVDALARHEVAEAIRYGRPSLASRDAARRLPMPLANEVEARVDELEANLRPPAIEYEAAYDALVHGTGGAS